MDVPILGGDLGYDCSNHIIGSISFNNNWIIRVEMFQDGCHGKGMFEGSECLGVVRTPYEGGVLAGETDEGNDDARESHNESSIEVGEA